MRKLITISVPPSLIKYLRKYLSDLPKGPKYKRAKISQWFTEAIIEYLAKHPDSPLSPEQLNIIRDELAVKRSKSTIPPRQWERDWAKTEAQIQNYYNTAYATNTQNNPE